MTRELKGWLFVALVGLLFPFAHAHARTGTSKPSAPPPPPPVTAPAGLAASASTGRVNLTWQPVDGATSYKVFRAANGTWTEAAIATTTKPAFTSSGLTNGTKYSFKVAATNRGGVGPTSTDVSVTPIALPDGFTAAAGDQIVTLRWQASPGATSYTLYRASAATQWVDAVLAEGVTTLTFTDTGLTNGAKYYYRIRAIGDGSVSPLSAKVSATPVPPPPSSAPEGLTAQPGNAKVTLTWGAVDRATHYRIFRGIKDAPEPPSLIAKVTTLTFRNTGLTNGTPYVYQVTAYNLGGDGPRTEPVTATPVAPPPAPEGLTATAGDKQITLAWTAVPEATSYSVYRSTKSEKQGSTALKTGLTDPSFVDSGLENGPTYYYRVTAVNAGGQSPKSAEANATPEGPPLVVPAETTTAFRLLRQATWGPRPGDVDRVKEMGVDAFLDEQFAQLPSVFPATLFNQPLEATQEYFMQIALLGGDQLRQRVAWALHKIWVVSAVEVDSPTAIVTYYRVLMDGAFGNYRDLMRNVTLNPAMGRYLNMLNNRSQKVTGVPPNENYPRELMQLFALGTALLNPDGTPVLTPGGAPEPSYTEDDVKALARILTGWTFGGSSGKRKRENFGVPMQAVEANHDADAKTFLGHSFAAGQSATQDLDQALDVLFNHQNIAPFVSRQLIQQLVTSNPSPAYVADIAAVFAGGGGAPRGDLAAVVRAILTHPEASLITANSGKLAEPVLFVVSLLRALNAQVTDHPFMSNKAEEMGQKVFYPPSVFSYFSPGYRVRGTAPPGSPLLGGPEFQILTSVTALVRANFIASVLGRRFGSDVTIDYTAFNSVARDAAALVDWSNLVFMGGRLSPEERREIITAVRATPITSTRDRVGTAIYLTTVIAQSQVDR